MDDTHKQSIPTGDSTAFQKELIRRRFLESVCAVLFILAVVGLPLSLARIPDTGMHFNHIVHSVMAALIIFMFFARKRLGDGWLVFLILSALTVVSLSSFLQYGVVSAGFYFGGACIFVAGVSLGLRGGVICAGFYAVAASIIAYLWMSGHLIFPVDANQYILMPMVWALLGVSFLVTTGIFFVSATGFFSDLTKLVDTIDTQKREIEERTTELSKANLELKSAMKEIKTLSGLLPICSKCKKIRDDQGYWQQVEEYVQHHTHAEFTHGLCPECLRELYPEVAERVLKRQGE